MLAPLLPDPVQEVQASAVPLTAVRVTDLKVFDGENKPTHRTLTFNPAIPIPSGIKHCLDKPNAKLQRPLRAAHLRSLTERHLSPFVPVPIEAPSLNRSYLV